MGKMNKRPRHLFRSRTRKPDHGELFKLAMEEQDHPSPIGLGPDRTELVLFRLFHAVSGLGSVVSGPSRVCQAMDVLRTNSERACAKPARIGAEGPRIPSDDLRQDVESVEVRHGVRDRGINPKCKLADS